METNPRLEVRFKLGQGVPLKIALQTDYMRTLSLLGRAFESEADGHATHKRLVTYLERKGTLVWIDAVKERMAAGQRAASKVRLVGGKQVCQTCYVCKACSQVRSTQVCLRTHAKKTCKCPFPRRQVPWGKIECEQDLAACDALQRRLAQQHAAGTITLERHHELYQWIERMKGRCKGKLFSIRQRMSEQEGPRDPKRTAAGIGRNVTQVTVNGLI